VAYSKLGQNKDALTDLNTCIQMNEDYVKAYAKRAEIYLATE
jgi:hypothetical protein